MTIFNHISHTRLSILGLGTALGFSLMLSPVTAQNAWAGDCRYVPLNCYNGQAQLPPHAGFVNFMQNPSQPIPQQGMNSQQNFGQQFQGHQVQGSAIAPQQFGGFTAMPMAGHPVSRHQNIGPMQHHPVQTAPVLRGPSRALSSPSPFNIRVEQPSYKNQELPYFAQVPDHVALERVKVHVQNDGLSVKPQLNVAVENGALAVMREQGARFTPFWNYGTFIRHGEVRMFAADASVRSRPLAILPVRNGMAILPAYAPLPDDLIYVLRVYDAKGKFDETSAKSLTLSDAYIEPHTTQNGDPFLAGYGIDHTAVRNIKVRGAAITVRGDNVPMGGFARVANIGIPVDEQGRFVTQMILPYGHFGLDVDVGSGGQIASYRRNVHIDDTEVFYVAIGEVTLGKQRRSGPASFLGSGDDDLNGKYARGRGAMYLKGKVRGDYRVTAAIDTGEERLSDIFKNLDKKDPRQLLRRLDGDKFYPVYGDDSVLVEDAPTQGKFYVRVEKDDSHIMYGNFATNITGTEFAHLDRGLYGGIIDHRSLATTEAGDRKTHVTMFAADPGTIPARNEFRGTGGSLYFLDRQDISIGSERLRVEVRDKVSGLVIESRDLIAQNDYEIDYIQGRILLSTPLQSTSNDDQVVRSGDLSGNDVYLVTRYEYTPSIGDVDGYTLGGRATQWVGNHLRLGVTAQSEKTDSADQEVFAGDFLLRGSAGTYVKGEYARSEGPGFGKTTSTDGGFNFDGINSFGTLGQSADAYRLEMAIDLADISGLRGTTQIYYDHQEAGFSGTGRQSQYNTQRLGGKFKAMLTRFTELSVKVDEIKAKGQGKTLAVYADVSQKLSQRLSATLGIRHDERFVNNTGQAINLTSTGFGGGNGARTDASMQIDFRGSSKWGVYVFGQTTIENDLERNSNDRVGFGGQFKITDRLDVEAEISDGEAGLGANIQTTFARSDSSEYYMGYALSPDHNFSGLGTQSRINGENGTLTFGARTRYSDALSVYGEERLAFGNDRHAYTHAYGLSYNPTDAWSFGMGVENGTIEDINTGDFERTAFSLSAGYTTDNFRLVSSLEGRFEDGTGGNTGRDRTTWLMRNTLALQATNDWELLGRFNFARSESDETSIIDAEFTEGVLAAAYRPVGHDRLNALLKYTYFENTAPASQVSNTQVNNLASQRSQIISVDAVYDLSDKFTVGAKYGFRSGEVALNRLTSDYIDSNAHIGVVRLDYHVARKWDMLAEARVLSSALADDTQYGALIGLYRHLGDHAKIGVGYNFSRFSDDLTNFDTDHEGYFVNLVSKF